MIRLFEHHQYSKNLDDFVLNEEQQKKLSLLKVPYCRLFQQKRGGVSCLSVSSNEDKTRFNFETSYFVGIDWIVEGEQPVYVQPKLNNNEIQIDYLSMLFESLQEPDNFDHLEGLLDIDFKKSHIEIEQDQDILSPFLLIQFIQVLRNIVRKGLKKSYYKVSNNLEAKVKGKILLNRTFKENVLKNKLTTNTCQYEEFGVNNEENKILKKAFIFTRHAILAYKGLKDERELEHVMNFINPVFEGVSDNVAWSSIKSFKPNPMYKEYEQGLKLAMLILKRYSYNIENTELAGKVKTPPFWIDMSKLFELYIFKKLREVFPKHGEIKYHYKTNRQELDFLLDHTDSNGQKMQIVIDAKYKPRYENGSISPEDARQLSGYARLEKVYKALQIEDNRLIDCLIIFSNTSDKFAIEKKELLSHKEAIYKNFYKLGIGLPKL